MPFSFTDAAALVNPAYFKLPERTSQDAWNTLHQRRGLREVERSNMAGEAARAADLAERERAAREVDARLRDNMAQQQAQFEAEQQLDKQKEVSDVFAEAYKLAGPDRQASVDARLSAMGAQKTAGNTEAELLAESARNRESLQGMGAEMTGPTPAIVGEPDPSYRAFTADTLSGSPDILRPDWAIRSPGSAPGMQSTEADMQRAIERDAPDITNKAFDNTIGELAGDQGTDLAYDQTEFAPKYSLGGMNIVGPDFAQEQADRTRAGRAAFEAKVAGVIPREHPLFDAAIQVYEDMAQSKGPDEAADYTMQMYVNPAAGRMAGDERAEMAAKARARSGQAAQGRYDSSDWDRGHDDAAATWARDAKPAADGYAQANQLLSDMKSPELYNNPVAFAAAVTRLGKVSGEDRMSDADAKRYAGTIGLLDMGEEAISKAISGELGEQRKRNIIEMVGAMQKHARSKLILSAKLMENQAMAGKSPDYIKGFRAVSDSNFGAIGLRKKQKTGASNGAGASPKAAAAAAAFQE